MEAERTWMTTAQAARRLGMSRARLYRVIDSGTLPAYKIGRLIRLQVGDVEAYRREHPPEPRPS
ncbi:MAG TPA: helix-turn-helix domain-containing protein [Acidimicrobiales bacterium]|nr:helix-turn-helix domain-containing protein [Acidimicrobiales bacterium]